MPPSVKVDSTISGTFEPDIVNISVLLEGEATTKREATRLYNEALTSLLDATAALGIPREEVRNSRLSIWSYRDKETDEELYEYWGHAYFNLPCEEELFNAAWKALTDLGNDVSINFDYGLKDYEQAKETLIRRAVDAGRRRASLLAEVTGCDLGTILHVENDLSGKASDDWRVEESSSKSGASQEQDCPVFNPSPIEVRCEVSLEYELAPRR